MENTVNKEQMINTISKKLYRALLGEVRRHHRCSCNMYIGYPYVREQSGTCVASTQALKDYEVYIKTLEQSRRC